MKQEALRYIAKFGLVCLLGTVILAACGPAPVERKKTAKKTCAQCHPELVAEYQTAIVDGRFSSGDILAGRVGFCWGGNWSYGYRAFSE